MNYYLVGYMYCGKTTFGRQLAQEKGMDYLDLDRAFEARYHYTVPMFFQRFGEQAFRTLESQLLRSTAELDNCVIATGGGTPCHSGNMDFILQHGTAIYLQMSADALVQRALRSRNPRPLMQGLSHEEMRLRIETQLKEREPVYLRAPIILDGNNPELPEIPDHPGAPEPPELPEKS